MNGQASAGTANVHANTNGTHFFGPEGTYTSSSCSPTTLGPRGPIAITVDPFTLSGVSGTASCLGATGQYWRLNTHVHLQWTTSCTVNGGVADSDVLFMVDGEQEPVSRQGFLTIQLREAIRRPARNNIAGEPLIPYSPTSPVELMLPGLVQLLFAHAVMQSCRNRSVD